MQKVQDIRDKFIELYKQNNFVIDKNGTKVVELIGESFEADESFIFGKPNDDYIRREIQWYESQSLNVNDIPGKTPKIWIYVADASGYINSNYGWMIFSKDNGNQYQNVLQELTTNSNSRRATMIYNRPDMWLDYNRNGMDDFCCTHSTQHMLRNNILITYVLMRSNDAWAGYRNDYGWHKHVIDKLRDDLEKNNVDIHDTKIIWTSGSLHIYERQFYLLEHYLKTGEPHILKKDFNKNLLRNIPYNKQN